MFDIPDHGLSELLYYFSSLYSTFNRTACTRAWSCLTASATISGSKRRPSSSSSIRKICLRRKSRKALWPFASPNTVVCTRLVFLHVVNVLYFRCTTVSRSSMVQCSGVFSSVLVLRLKLVWRNVWLYPETVRGPEPEEGIQGNLHSLHLRNRH